MKDYLKHRIKSNQKGVSLIESLVAILILAVVGLSITYNTVASYQLTHRNIRHSIASQLALEKMEELAARNPASLTPADGGLEEGLLVGNMEFNRNTEVLVNADESRTVSVEVLAVNEDRGGSATLVNTFALWGAL